MEPMITTAPIRPGGLLYKRDGSSNNSSGALDTCGYLSGDYASPLTCRTGYTCSTGPSLLASHLGCCNAVNCAPSSGAHTCITAKSGTIPCTGDFSTGCIQEYTSLLFCTDPTAPACITYSQPPPSSGSAADAGFSPTIFSYSCGPTQTTHIYLATATNAPASTVSHTPTTFNNLPNSAYVGIGIGGFLVLVLIGSIRWWCFRGSEPPRPTSQGAPSLGFTPSCRYCGALGNRGTVHPANPNGNYGRSYFICPQCRSRPKQAGEYAEGWIAWDDWEGVVATNPPCKCHNASRQDRAGPHSRFYGRAFWTCTRGACDYFAWL